MSYKDVKIQAVKNIIDNYDRLLVKNNIKPPDFFIELQNYHDNTLTKAKEGNPNLSDEQLYSLLQIMFKDSETSPLLRRESPLSHFGDVCGHEYSILYVELTKLNVNSFNMFQYALILSESPGLSVDHAFNMFNYMACGSNILDAKHLEKLLQHENKAGVYQGISQLPIGRINDQTFTLLLASKYPEAIAQIYTALTNQNLLKPSLLEFAEKMDKNSVQRFSQLLFILSKNDLLNSEKDFYDVAKYTDEPYLATILNALWVSDLFDQNAYTIIMKHIAILGNEEFFMKIINVPTLPKNFCERIDTICAETPDDQTAAQNVLSFLDELITVPTNKADAFNLEDHDFLSELDDSLADLTDLISSSIPPLNLDVASDALSTSRESSKNAQSAFSDASAKEIASHTAPTSRKP